MRVLSAGWWGCGADPAPPRKRLHRAGRRPDDQGRRHRLRYEFDAASSWPTPGHPGDGGTRRSGPPDDDGVRLGQGVDRTGRLAPEALERTFDLREYAAIIKRHGAERLRFVATSASRDAENRDEFVRGVLDILGVRAEVITGDEEGAGLLIGATKELTGRDDLAKPYLVVDIGGGSTELVVGDDRACAPPAPWTSVAYG